MSDLYRFFDKDGALLYVGISLSAVHRASQHRATQGWWPLVTRMEVEHHDVDRSELEALERDAIHRERPRFNVIHNGTSAIKKAKWNCGTCRAPMDDGYIQVADQETLSWECVCKRCDNSAETYWIALKRIDNYDDIAKWTEHLLGKVWFDLDEWRAMLERSCQIQQWVGAVLHARDVRLHRQQLT